MRVVVAYHYLDGATSWVHFSSSLGEGEARWKGAPPEAGREYFVELDLIGPVEITPARVRLPLLDAERDQVLARGRVEQLHDDGVAVVRLGEDSSAPLLLIEQARMAAGSWLAIRAAALALHDENL